MENLFLKKLKLILFKYFLSKVINLDFSKKFFFSRKKLIKNHLFLKNIFLVDFLKDEINTNILQLIIF